MQDTCRTNVLKLDERTSNQTEDDVVVEEPLEIRVNKDSVGVTMRTPGDDFDLAVGLLRTEAFIQSMHEIGTISYCPDEDQPELRNVINVTLVDTARRFESTRNTWASSSCGLCGKATLEAVRRNVSPIRNSSTVEYRTLVELPEGMRQEQTNFNRTGGIHAAALFNAAGKLLLVREDLGRHNAVDKVLGAALRAGQGVSETVLMVSGRLGFEIIQKAAVAGIAIVASVSAPSSLAIELAVECGMTAIGFVRGSSLNIYSHPERVRS